MTVDGVMLMNGFWLGVGFWTATVAVFIFVLITTVITGLIVGFLDTLSKKSKGR